MTFPMNEDSCMCVTEDHGHGSPCGKPAKFFTKIQTRTSFARVALCKDCASKSYVEERLVGERGFEPPTPWSRTRCSTRLSHSPTKSIVCAREDGKYTAQASKYRDCSQL